MIVRLLICICAAGVALYAYIDKQNSLTELRIAIPSLDKQVKEIQIENVRLQYEVERMESPDRLLKIADQPEYSSLRYPYENEIIFLP